MKKFLTMLAVAGLTLSAHAGAQFRSFSFMAQGITSFTVTNAAAAPLGGYTNVNSWSYSAIDPAVTLGTNSLALTWTNALGKWVIPTNAAVGTVSGITFLRTPESTSLTTDVPLWTDLNGQPAVWNFPAATNSLMGFGQATQGAVEAMMISSMTLNCKIYGAASAANTLNLIFVGVPDGTNEAASSLTTTAIPAFQWGITAAAGTTVVSTNFPSWRFAGMKAIRLRSATLTTTTAANIGVTIQNLSLNGFVP